MNKLVGNLLCLIFVLLLVAPLQAKWNPLKKSHKRSGEENCQLLLKELQQIDPDVQKIIKKSIGWAIFPRIGKAGIGIGGAAGNGRVYKKGKFIGTATMKQLSIGFQFGGQVYGEVIFFEDSEILNKFKNGKFEIGANLSAVVIDKGAAGTATFKNGTLVIVKPQKGLMYEATLSGQKFTFKGRK